MEKNVPRAGVGHWLSGNVLRVSSLKQYMDSVKKDYIGVQLEVFALDHENVGEDELDARHSARTSLRKSAIENSPACDDSGYKRWIGSGITGCRFCERMSES